MTSCFPSTYAHRVGTMHACTDMHAEWAPCMHAQICTQSGHHACTDMYAEWAPCMHAQIYA